MRGEIFRYDDNTGEGLISGDDGFRYTFTRADLKQLVPIQIGMRVDFDHREEGRAREIYFLDAQAPPPPPPQAAAAQAAPGPAQTGPLQSSGEDLGLWDYFAKCMRLYFNGAGRARRKELWGFVLFSSIFTFVAAIVDIAWNAGAGNYPYVMVFTALTQLGFLAPSITVGIRRFHDLGLTGWFVLIGPLTYGVLFFASPGLALLVYLAYIVALGFIPSQLRVNEYGLYPKPVPPHLQTAGGA